MKRAFTLLEILISVVVLAIGLVGVVAIFPAVIDLQRRAQDTVIGQNAASSAEAQLVGTFIENPSLNWLDWTDWSDVFNESDLSLIPRFPVFDTLKRDVTISVRDSRIPVGASDYVYNFLWETNWDWERPENDDAFEVLTATGDLVIGGGRGRIQKQDTNGNLQTVQITLPTVTLSLADRLMPDAASGADPRYIYDMVVRRVDAGIGYVPRGDSGRRTYERRVPADRLEELPLQIAVFVRRVDRNIRVPLGVSIREALSGEYDDPEQDGRVPDRNRRLPLAVDPGDACRLVQNGKPGDHSYSTPVAALLRDTTILQSDDSRPDVWDLFDPVSLRHVGNGTNATSAAERLTQVGQMFVDNTGTVRKVTAIVQRQVDGGDRDVLVVDPPFSSNSTDEYRQIVFTPQVPVDIRVLTTR
ncbi:MAG TPA: hypothetical protein DEB57_14175 [Microbacterium sp.]|nr:hypothetical protein [Microbacterium sp.]